MQIILGILALIIIITIVAVKFDTISHQLQMRILKIIAIILTLGWLYQTFVDSTETSHRELVIAFKQGKTLLCKEQPIHNKHFYYEGGTMSFVAYDKNNSVTGFIYPINDCKIKEDQ